MRYFNEVFKKYDELNNWVQENVTAIRVVKAYVREDHEKSKFIKASENVYKMFCRAESVVVLNMPLMQLATYVCILVISFLQWIRHNDTRGSVYCPDWCVSKSVGD